MRGAFICLEGIDNSGKTTVASELQRELEGKGYEVVRMNFPNRTSPTGKILNSYLQNTADEGAKVHFTPEAVHLLYTANRWECAPLVQSYLETGKIVICDRYSFSGAAYSMSKGLSKEWCMAPETGLPRPDIVLYLDLSPKMSLERAASSGKKKEIFDEFDPLTRIHDAYEELFDESFWTRIDASQTQSIVQKNVSEAVSAILTHIKTESLPIHKL